jgi:hypothetical protein
MRVRTEEEDDKRKGWARWAARSGLAPLLLSPFFFDIASSFLAAIFWGKTREGLKRALKQIRFGRI